jgi:hypothetical protein
MFSLSDPSSFLFLLIGKDHPWLPLFLVGFLLIQNWSSLKQFYLTTNLFKKSQYKLTTKVYTNVNDNYTYGIIPANVWALIYYIDTRLKSKDIQITNAVSFPLPYNELFPEKAPPILPPSDTTISLTPNIRCRITVEKDTGNMLGNESREKSSTIKSALIEMSTITFTLLTNKELSHLFEFLDGVLSTYTTKLDLLHNKELRIYKPAFKTPEFSPTELYFPVQNMPFQSSKSFNNLFFTGKEALIKRLSTFVHREKYKCLGLPETLGLLFYGTPGTGKTSCIKAVANYLNMHLIIVPMNQIRTKKRLEELFFSDNLAVPQEKRIYVFEEIDCNGWDKYICPRCSQQPSSSSSPSADSSGEVLSQIATALLDEKTKEKIKKEEEDLTLGAILEVIDGLMECPGRVIIMTTNHPDKLDPALRRPGRIDMEIEFTNLQKEHIYEIYKKWYGSPIPESDLQKIPDGVFTQAEISQKLFKHETDPLAFLNEIRGGKN